MMRGSLNPQVFRPCRGGPIPPPALSHDGRQNLQFVKTHPGVRCYFSQPGHVQQRPKTKQLYTRRYHALDAVYICEKMISVPFLLLSNAAVNGHNNHSLSTEPRYLAKQVEVSAQIRFLNSHRAVMNQTRRLFMLATLDD